jgi:hypothetical protein
MKDNEREFFDRLLKFTHIKEILQHSYISSAIYKELIKKSPMESSNLEESKESF